MGLTSIIDDTSSTLELKATEGHSVIFEDQNRGDYNKSLDWTYNQSRSLNNSRRRQLPSPDDEADKMTVARVCAINSLLNLKKAKQQWQSVPQYLSSILKLKFFNYSKYK